MSKAGNESDFVKDIDSLRTLTQTGNYRAVVGTVIVDKCQQEVLVVSSIKKTPT
jgi:hypothetical protein